MKILIVCGEYFNKSNGLSISTQRFVKEFMRLGHEVRVLSSAHGGVSDYSVPVMHVPLFDGIMDRQNYRFGRPDAHVVNQALAWADIVHIEDPFPLSVQTARAARRKKLPITGTFHLYPENMTASVPILNFRLSNLNILQAFRLGVYRYCCAIQCPTEKVRRRLLANGYRSKLHVISNGIPQEYIADTPSTEKNSRFTVISVGRYSREKDQRTLIHAVGLCKYAADIQLILAGRGPLEQQYRKLGAALPNPPILSFYDQQELRQQIRRADLYVHCARVEIEGMGCMEAFAQGTVPIIADSTLSSTSDYALTEKNRYRAGDAKDLVSKLEYWYTHRDQLYPAGSAYIDLAKSLSIEKSARQVLQMMEEAVRQGIPG